jgi:pantoate--beta-alanine ligase
LTPEQRKTAPVIQKILRESPTAAEAAAKIEKFENGLMKVDYVEDFGGRRYAAVKLGEVRLIDNIQI